MAGETTTVYTARRVITMDPDLLDHRIESHARLRGLTST